MKKTNVVFCVMALPMFACSTSRAQDKLYLNKFPLQDAMLLEGPFQHALELNIKVLLEYDVHHLLAGYRKEAGLSEKKKIHI